MKTTYTGAISIVQSTMQSTMQTSVRLALMLILGLLTLSTNTTAFAEEKTSDEIKPFKGYKSSIQETAKTKVKAGVKVVVPLPKDDVSKPDSWEPEIGPIKSYTDYSAVKTASYQKKQDRTSAAYQRKQDATTDIFTRFQKEELTALKKLKIEDVEAAFYYLEVRAGFGLFFDLEAIGKEPTSAAYREFKNTLKDIRKRKDPETKQAEGAYDSAVKRAEEIYDAETAKAEEIYEEIRESKS